MRTHLTLTLFALLATAASAGPLRGALIVAADGTFLGTCDGKYATHSIANPYGRYGSKYSSTSIFNEYGTYGSKYASYSAFNPSTSSAPYVLSSSPELLRLFTSVSYRPTPQIVSSLRASGASRVTANRGMPGAIDPNVLRVACENP
ncbi:hypothetical protein L1280_000546 [Deinococcus sp. HSC-46F16]|uniref:hypothetical protein n=1 Tax=Deinococcus sp. HSC-46F16 TaxID=2910968 RepID=UPI0020A05A21|nr:hypothetical protein [Deinococcus sp. HSC-46F16]MCP2013418.1 hypothetical protein [Deinococcus sp. HSC-46F16]